MKKILLVGKTDGFLRMLSPALSAHYIVRFGSSEPLAVFAILKSLRPDLIIVNTAEVSMDTMSRIGSEYGEIPVIAIAFGNESDTLSGLHPRKVCTADTNTVSDAVFSIIPYSPEDEDSRPPIVLVIDDDAAMLRMIKTMIEDEFEPVLAPSGAKALRLIERKRPDVILLDHEMPEMNGIETLGRLRADERFADIPVVFLTGSRSPDILDNINTAGAAGVLIKPADAPDIKAAVRKALNK